MSEKRFLRADPRRFYFTGKNPGTGNTLFIKRTGTEEEVSKAKTLTGKPFWAVRRHEETLQNEALALAFVKKHTSIPVPKVVATFVDRQSAYLVEEFIEDAIPAWKAPPDTHPKIAAQLAKYMEELHSLKSDNFKSFTGRPFMPARLSSHLSLENYEYPARPDGYVLCHGDIGWHNVMVDKSSFEIVSIIDWEWAGFYPVEVEGEYWKRAGTCQPRKEEHNDVNDLVDMLYKLAASKPERPLIAAPSAAESSTQPQQYQIKACDLPTAFENHGNQKQLPALEAYTTGNVRISEPALITREFGIARIELGQALIDVSSKMDEERLYMREWSRGADDARYASATVKTGNLGYTVFDLFNKDLTGLLPPLFRDLGERLSDTSNHLNTLQDHLLAMDKIRRDNSIASANESEMKDLAGLGGQTRGLADQAVRDMEMAKWQALKKFGHDVFLLAHAAEQYFPWYPTMHGSPPARSDEGEGKVRREVEGRLRDFIADGSGGWKVEVRDMTAEEYSPPKWKGNEQVKE